MLRTMRHDVEKAPPPTKVDFLGQHGRDSGVREKADWHNRRRITHAAALDALPILRPRLLSGVLEYSCAAVSGQNGQNGGGVPGVWSRAPAR